METTQVWDIIGGPSKFDFLQSLSFRKHPAQSVRFTVRDKEGVVEVFEVELHTVMQFGGPDENGEGHCWRFATGYPVVVRDSHWVSLHFTMLGEFFTGGKKGKTGTLKSLDHKQTRLFDAVFGNVAAMRELRDAGYKIPDMRLGRLTA